MDTRSLAADVVKGAIAGAVGTKALEYATRAAWRVQGEESRTREKDTRHGQYSSEVAAEKAAALVGKNLDEAGKETGGEIMHWGLGIGAGVAYALARRKWPQATAGRGAAFGAAFFVTVDEGLNTVFGFAPPPLACPWQAHARGFAGHVAYGVAADATLDALDRVGRA